MADRFNRGNPDNTRDSGGFHRGSSNRTGDATLAAGITPSSLLENTNKLRNELISRNLYTPNRLYPITEKNQLQNVLNSVNGIISLIAPFKSYNLNNTWYGRLVTVNTPLSEIGLAMLGKQFAMNFGSHTAQQNFPKIKVANLFDGNKNTHLFSKNIDFTITKKTAKSNFQQFINDAISYYPARDNPFKPSSTNANYIQNSGTGQLTFLYQSLNQNIYKQGYTYMNYFGISGINDGTLNQYGDKADFPLTKRNAIIGNKDSVGTVNLSVTKYAFYYDFFNTNPYSRINPSQDAINQADSDTIVSLNTPNPIHVNTSEEYAPTAAYVKFNFGTTNTNGDGEILNNKASSNSWINESDEFGDTLANKIVWGRNSVSDLANERIAQLRGNTNNEREEDVAYKKNLHEFNVYSGLLEYTRNLLNASQGAVIDITRKAFKSGDNLVGFQGSGLFVAPSNTYTNYPGNEIAGIRGVRQHTVIDQYDRFAKAIRFNGNKVYNASGGNKDSVIYNSVLPRIHPTMPVGDGGVPNNRNLMLTIENLAVRVISKDGVGIIDDEYGSMIPICEVGPFNGRQMWFPPYNMEINESTASNFDKTVMVGRNEPMYSYMHSERSATLSFTLLVDYPQNLKNLLYQGADKHRIISEFFAFGGDGYTPEVVINNPNLKIVENNNDIEVIVGPGGAPPVDTPDSPEIKMVFPNDMPSAGYVNTIVDKMYLEYQYEIEKGLVSNSGWVNPGGVNVSIFIKTGVVGDSSVKPFDDGYMHLDKSLLPAGFSQYTQSGTTCDLNKYLYDIFNVENNNKYFEIRIFGHTTTLNDKVTNYNLNLGQRRADAAKHLVEERLKAIFNKPLEELGIKIIAKSRASEGSDPANSEGKTKKEIFDKLEQQPAIEERYATIQMVRTSFPPLEKIKPITIEELKVVTQLKEDNVALGKTISKQNSNNVSQCVMEERKNANGSGDGGILSGFKSVEGNYYYPAFHSQTPEDFHKRLTFLQQCMRQGAAKRYDAVDENGILRARNSVFGRQPICILRVGDFFHTKVIIENLTIDYTDTTWDMNPEGFGMQPMIAKVTLQMKVIGGQSLKGPIDALQNAVSFNYYANSSFSSEGLYARPYSEAEKQGLYVNGIDGKTGLLGKERTVLNDAYNKKFPPQK